MYQLEVLCKVVSFLMEVEQEDNYQSRVLRAEADIPSRARTWSGERKEKNSHRSSQRSILNTSLVIEEEAS